jgi:hypothetical protein
VIYPVRILVALDQLATALLGGWPDETLSSYAWRLEQQGKLAGRIFRPLIDWLFLWESPHHCERAAAYERLRLQIHPDLR